MLTVLYEKFITVDFFRPKWLYGRNNWPIDWSIWLINWFFRWSRSVAVWIKMLNSYADGFVRKVYNYWLLSIEKIVWLIDIIDRLINRFRWSIVAFSMKHKCSFLRKMLNLFVVDFVQKTACLTIVVSFFFYQNNSIMTI